MTTKPCFYSISNFAPWKETSGEMVLNPSRLQLFQIPGSKERIEIHSQAVKEGYSISSCAVSTNRSTNPYLNA